MNNIKSKKTIKSKKSVENKQIFLNLLNFLKKIKINNFRRDEIIIEPSTQTNDIKSEVVQLPIKKNKKNRKRDLLLLLNKIKIHINKLSGKISVWYLNKKELRAFFILVSQILFDGLLISIPFWVFIKFNLLTIPAFGSALIIIKKQILPIIVQILGSFSLVRIAK